MTATAQGGWHGRFYCQDFYQVGSMYIPTIPSTWLWGINGRPRNLRPRRSWTGPGKPSSEWFAGKKLSTRFIVQFVLLDGLDTFRRSSNSKFSKSFVICHFLLIDEWEVLQQQKRLTEKFRSQVRIINDNITAIQTGVLHWSSLYSIQQRFSSTSTKIR